MYIAVSGNIGSGKTSLVEILARRLNFIAYYEDIENPYLEDFYENMDRWSFNLQVCFLSKKIKQLQEITAYPQCVIQDRTVYEEAYIFVNNLKSMGLMSERDYNTYMDVFAIAIGNIPQPDVVIYLKASTPTLLKQIYKRGRAYEMRIEPDYLKSLNTLYNNWIENIYEGDVIVIDMDKEEFLESESAVDKIIERLTPYIKKSNDLTTKI